MVISRVDDLLGDRIERAVRAHHRRRLARLGHERVFDAPAGGLHYTDGAFIYAGYFPEAFPFLQAPLPGSPNEDNAIKRAAAK